MIRRFSLLTAVALGLVVTGIGGVSPAQAAKRPVVNMAAVGAAAHTEPQLGNRKALGDDASTKRIQRALNAKGFRTPVNGRYGAATTKAYAKFQRSLGYRGMNANGIPGRSSLARLGAGRFTVVNRVVVGSRNDRYGNARVNTRTALMLAAADRRLPWKLRVSQGSYCTLTRRGCAGESAGTHDGGGAVDIRASGLSPTARWRTVEALRRVGFAAWLRTPSQCGGCWPYHIHAIAIGDADVWQRNGGRDNRDQVADYYRGRNGLANHARDNTPRAYRVPFTWWEKYSRG